MTPPLPQHSLRLLSQVGKVESAQTFPPGFFPSPVWTRLGIIIAKRKQP